MNEPSIDIQIDRALIEAERNGIKPRLIELGSAKWHEYREWIHEFGKQYMLNPGDPDFGEDRYCGVRISRSHTPGIVISP